MNCTESYKEHIETHLTPFAKQLYTMQLSTHGVTGINGGKGKYPLKISPKKSFTRSVQQMNILQTPLSSTLVRYAGRGLSLRTGSLPKPCPLCRRKRGELSIFSFSGVTHRRKSGNYTDTAEVQHGITYKVLYKCCMKKWWCFSMRNPKLVWQNKQKNK